MTHTRIQSVKLKGQSVQTIEWKQSHRAIALPSRLTANSHRPIRAATAGWSSSRLRPTRSPPTSLLIVTAAACAAVPAHNRRSTLLSSRCITPIGTHCQLTFSHLHLYMHVFRQRLRHFVFDNTALMIFVRINLSNVVQFVRRVRTTRSFV